MDSNYYSYSSYGGYRPYVRVAQRRANAAREMNHLRRRGKTIEPIAIEGRRIARRFWGQAWCDHLESLSDFENRLPRGRTYVRNGSVCHLAIRPGRVEAIVSGSELYDVSVRIRKLRAATWRAVTRRCAGGVGSMLELLQGELSDRVMRVVTDRNGGLFPAPSDIRFECSCPDWASMCKHVAAVLYGVGNRLDAQPELLFRLRGVDASELIATDLALPEERADGLADDQLGEIFGIELETARSGAAAKPSSAPRAKSKGRKSSRPKTRGKSSAPRRRAPGAAEKPGAAPTVRIRPTGKSVERLRRRLGLSAKAFATELGVSPATVYRWESTAGRLRLRAEALSALAALTQSAKPSASRS